MGQLTAQFIQAAVFLKDGLRLHAQGQYISFPGDVGIAVAVAADPGTEASIARRS